jgi:hypothetical protein
MRENMVSFDALRELSNTLRNDACKARYGFDHVKVSATGQIGCFENSSTGGGQSQSGGHSRSVHVDPLPLFAIDASEQNSKIRGSGNGTGSSPVRSLTFITLAVMYVSFI